MDDDVVAKLMSMLAIGVASFLSGATALAADVSQTILGAQVDNSLLVGIALFALTTSTAVLAWVFKLLLQMRDSAARSETKLEELERRMNAWEN